MIRTQVRPRRSLAWGIAGALTTGGLVLAPSVGADAAPDPLACPTSFDRDDLVEPVDDATPGTAVTGLATSRGTTPDAITGSYVGTIEDGVGPGKDLLVFKLAGSRITKADGSVDAGIWAGMSGSPLYVDVNGTRQIVGAVSYGFSLESSDFAGVTPADDLRAIERAGSGAARASVPSGLAATMRAEGASTTEVRQGFRRLPVARSVAAGITGSRLAGAARKTGFAAPVARAAGGAPASATSYPIRPGGPVATSYAFGNVNFTGVGTVTMVCGGKVFAYGHPDSFTGPSTMGMHGASVVMIQRDNAAGSAVIANVGRLVGQITQDRTSGIMGVVGTTPPSARVRTRTTVVGRGTHHAVSQVPVADALGFAAYAQSVGEVDAAYDGYQQGTADVQWAISGKRRNGRTFQVRGSNRLADRYDIGAVTGSDATGDLFAIADNDFEDVTITDVWMSTTITPRYHAYRLGTIRAKQRGAWRPVGAGSRIKVNAGKQVRLRVSLVPQRGSIGSPRTVSFSTKVPRRYRGERLMLEVGGLADRYGYIDDEELIEEDVELAASRRSEPTSFPAVLSALASSNERNDQLVSTLYAFDDELEDLAVVGRRTVRAPSIVSGSATMLIKVKR